MLRTYKFKLDAEKFKITPEGYLDCVGACARIGIQTYHDNGGPSKEFRSEKEVFHPDSLETHKLVPVTIQHPESLVNSESFKDFTIGMTGTTPRRDGDHLLNDFRIMDKDAVDWVLKRRDRGEPTEISMGYNSGIDPTPGEFRGEKYDALQKDIRINHAALCDQGEARAGREAKLRLDKLKERKDSMKTFKKDAVNIENFHMDQVEMEYHDDSETIVSYLTRKLDDAIGTIKGMVSSREKTKKDSETAVAAEKKETEKMKAKADQLESDSKKLKDEVDELTNLDSPRMQELIKEKSRIKAVAAHFKVDTKGKTDKQIKLDIIKAVSPEFDTEKEENKKDGYVNGRFDLIFETARKDIEKMDASKNSLSSFLENVGEKKKEDTKKTDYRGNFAEKSRNMWKPKTASNQN